MNIGGFKFAPTEVEEVALRMPMVADCTCVPYDDENLGKVLEIIRSPK